MTQRLGTLSEPQWEALGTPNGVHSDATIRALHRQRLIARRGGLWWRTAEGEAKLRNRKGAKQ